MTEKKKVVVTTVNAVEAVAEIVEEVLLQKNENPCWPSTIPTTTHLAKKTRTKTKRPPVPSPARTLDPSEVAAAEAAVADITVADNVGRRPMHVYQ